MGCKSSSNVSTNHVRPPNYAPNPNQANERQNAEAGRRRGRGDAAYVNNMLRAVQQQQERNDLDRIERIIPGEFVGEGIKRTPAFTVTVTKEEYPRWVEQFWGTRAENSPEVWEVLRAACGADHESAEAIVIASNLVLQNGLLGQVYDERGRLYQVPFACINEPKGFAEDAVLERLKSMEPPA